MFSKIYKKIEAHNHVNEKRVFKKMLAVSSTLYLLILFINGVPLILKFFLLFLIVGSIFYHLHPNNIILKTYDWLLALLMCFYVYVYYNSYYKTKVPVFGKNFIVTLLLFLIVLRVIDHVLFKKHEYKYYSFTHSIWHILSALFMLLVF